MEVVVYNSSQAREIERFDLSPYKMNAFLEEINYNCECNSVDENVLVKLYDAGHLILLKKISISKSLSNLLNSNKNLLI